MNPLNIHRANLFYDTVQYITFNQIPILQFCLNCTASKGKYISKNKAMLIQYHFQRTEFVLLNAFYFMKCIYSEAIFQMMDTLSQLRNFFGKNSYI